MQSYLNEAFPIVDVNSINVTLTPVQTTPGSPTRSTVARYTLSVTITYLPSGGENVPITITSLALGGLLLTQLGSDDFVSALQEDDARIGALIIDANAVPAPTPTPTPPSTLLPTTSPTLRPTTSPTLKPTALPTAVPTKSPTPQPTLNPTPVPTPK